MMISRFVKSWLSLKLWVKIWLIWINVIFLAAFLYLDQTSAKWILIAYAAAAPIIVYLTGKSDGGLTRQLGLCHIIPWTPLAIYLIYLLGSGHAIGSYSTFLWVLLITIIACLAFDVYDLIRWYQGERYTMGTREAYEAGASSITLE